jgi:hypothetical protein
LFRIRLVKNQAETAFKALGKTVSKTVKACSHHKPYKGSGCMVEPQAAVHCAELGIMYVTGDEFALAGDDDSRDQFGAKLEAWSLSKGGGFASIFLSNNEH